MYIPALFWLAFLIVTLLLNVYVLNYAYALERKGCTCALTWHHQYTKVHLAIQVFVFATLITLALGKFNTYIKVYQRILVAFLPFSIAYTAVTWLYIRHLKQVACDCSESMERIIMQFVATAQSMVFSFYGLLFLAGVAAVWFKFKKSV